MARTSPMFSTRSLNQSIPIPIPSKASQRHKSPEHEQSSTLESSPSEAVSNTRAQMTRTYASMSPPLFKPSAGSLRGSSTRKEHSPSCLLKKTNYSDTRFKELSSEGSRRESIYCHLLDMDEVTPTTTDDEDSDDGEDDEDEDCCDFTIDNGVPADGYQSQPPSPVSNHPRPFPAMVAQARHRVSNLPNRAPNSIGGSR